MKSDDALPEDLLDVPAVARLFSVSSMTIRNWIKRGHLCAWRIGRQFRLSEEDVREFMHRSRVPSAANSALRQKLCPVALSETEFATESGDRRE